HVQRLDSVAVDTSRAVVGGVHSAEESELLLAALSLEDGSELWRKRFAATGQVRCRELALDSRGNTVITGSFSESIDFDGTTLEANAGRAIFLASVSPEGDVLWAQRFGGAADNDGTSVAIAER